MRSKKPGPQKKQLALRLGWTVRSSRFLVQQPFVNVRQDQVSIGGRSFKYTYLEHPGAVFAVGFTRTREIVLIRIFRYTLDRWCWEIPSGGMGDKKGKSPLQVAKEEFLEEAGATARKWTNLGWKWSANGVAKLKLHFFLAEDVKLSQSQPEVSEQISQIKCLPYKQINAWIDSNKIDDGDSVLAIQLALRHLQKKDQAKSAKF